MAKKQKPFFAKATKGKEKEGFSKKIKQETKKGIFSVISFVVALFFMLSAFGKAGPAGLFFFDILTYLFGLGYYLLPIICILLGSSFFKSERPNIGVWHVLSSIFILLASLGIIDIVKKGAGGTVGAVASYPFVKLFGTYTSTIFLLAILVIALSILFDRRPNIWPVVLQVWNWFKNLFARHAEEIQNGEEVLGDSEEEVVIEVKSEEIKKEEPESK